MKSFSPAISFLLLFLLTITSGVAVTVAATPASSLSWRPLKIKVDETFLNAPAWDLHSKTGLAMSCPSVGTEVYSLGQNSGFPCFDGNETVQYSTNCKITCAAIDVASLTAVGNLKTALAEVKAEYESVFSVRTTDNSTINFQSIGADNCDGLSVTTPVSFTNADLLVYVTIRPLRQMLYPSFEITETSYCEFVPGSDRPAVVRLNVDPQAINLRSLQDIKNHLYKAFVRVLGFDLRLFPKFKHPADLTKTYAQFNPTKYPTGPISGTRISAVSGSPGNFTVGAAATTDKIYFHGPTTMSVAADFFACAGLASSTATQTVELENSFVTTPAARYIANLEKRIFPQELLTIDFNSSIALNTKISSLTQALLFDTGFYSVSKYHFFSGSGTNATGDSFASSFGYKLGCSFAQGSCKDWGEPYFCTSVAGGCSVDEAMADCDIMTYTTALPPAFQYFGVSAPLKGGADQYADFCPKFVKASGGECRVAKPTSPLVSQSGMYFGASSKCAITRMMNMNLKAPVSFPGCFGVVCTTFTSPSASAPAAAAHFIVGKEELVTCSKDNEILELVPPPRANLFLLQREVADAKAYPSYLFHGLLACKTLFSQCASDVTGLPKMSLPTPPSISGAFPNWAHYDGGSELIISGIGFQTSACVGLKVGGILTTNFKVINDTHLSATAGSVPATIFGGGNKNGQGVYDGLGDAPLQLLCPVPAVQSYGLCDPYCVVARAENLVQYALKDPNIIETQRPKMLSDFFLSPGGKSVGVLLSLITTFFFMWLVRKIFDKYYGTMPEEEKNKKEGEEGEGQGEEGKTEEIGGVEKTGGATKMEVEEDLDFVRPSTKEIPKEEPLIGVRPKTGGSSAARRSRRAHEVSAEVLIDL